MVILTTTAATALFGRLRQSSTSIWPDYAGPAIIDQFQQWPAVNALYWGSDLADGVTQLGAFLSAHQVGAVIVQEKRAANYLPVLAMLHFLSLPATHVGDVISLR